MLLVAFAALVAIFFFRLVFLQVIVADQYAAQAEESRTVSFDTTPRRGTIYDRNGIVLATSVDATTIYANPVEVTWPASSGERRPITRSCSPRRAPPSSTSSARPTWRRPTR